MSENKKKMGQCLKDFQLSNHKLEVHQFWKTQTNFYCVYVSHRSFDFCCIWYAKGLTQFIVIALSIVWIYFNFDRSNLRGLPLRQKGAINCNASKHLLKIWKACWILSTVNVEQTRKRCSKTSTLIYEVKSLTTKGFSIELSQLQVVVPYEEYQPHVQVKSWFHVLSLTRPSPRINASDSFWCITLSSTPTFRNCHFHFFSFSLGQFLIKFVGEF